jgi:hypothetical protein
MTASTACAPSWVMVEKCSTAVHSRGIMTTIAVTRPMAAVFRPEAAAALAEFASVRSQLLNQRPEFVNC